MAGRADGRGDIDAVHGCHGGDGDGAHGMDLDRRAWHCAAAAEGPDESVVTALDEVAERAGRRGGLEAASAAWERAAELSFASEPRAMRLLSAAGAAWASAQPARARALAWLDT